MRVLGVNSAFHDPSAAVVVDGRVVAAAEEERFSRRKHGKSAVPFSAWEQPQKAARWCLDRAGIDAADLDAIAFSYDPDLVEHDRSGMDPAWEQLRTTFTRRAPNFLATALPGADPSVARFVPHHVAHAASAGLAAPFGDCAVLTADGRGERTSSLVGQYRGGQLEVLDEQPLPDSLGLVYESLTEHLGFHRSTDEYKVMALASYAKPVFADAVAEHVHHLGGGRFAATAPDWSRWAPPRPPGGELREEHAQLAASVQAQVERVLLELARWVAATTGRTRLAVAGGIGLNCVANTRLSAETPFERVWVQPAAGDAGTSLGAALHVAAEAGDPVRAVPGVDLGREWTDAEIAEQLRASGVSHEQPTDVADAAAEALAGNGVVAWFQGRSEFGPRALGCRSLLAHPGHAGNVERLNEVKGREQFRPVAPVVLGDWAADLFHRGPLPSPHMLFVHDVDEQWQDLLPAVVHVDGTARVQTVDAGSQPLLARVLERFRVRTGLPVLINTSFNTAGRPMVDDPVDALECFGSSPIDVLAIGSSLVRRRGRG